MSPTAISYVWWQCIPESRSLPHREWKRNCWRRLWLRSHALRHRVGPLEPGRWGDGWTIQLLGTTCWGQSSCLCGAQLGNLLPSQYLLSLWSFGYEYSWCFSSACESLGVSTLRSIQDGWRAHAGYCTLYCAARCGPILDGRSVALQGVFPLFFYHLQGRPAKIWLLPIPKVVQRSNMAVLAVLSRANVKSSWIRMRLLFGMQSWRWKNNILYVLHLCLFTRSHKKYMYIIHIRCLYCSVQFGEIFRFA